MKRHKVRSKTDPNIIYFVDIHDTFSECTCPSFKFRHRCSHINYITKKYYAKRNNIEPKSN